MPYKKFEADDFLAAERADRDVLRETREDFLAYCRPKMRGEQLTGQKASLSRTFRNDPRSFGERE